MGGCGWGGGGICREIRIVTLCNQLLLQFTPGLYQTNTLLYGVHLRHTCDFSMTIIMFTEIMIIWIRHYFNNIFSSWNLCCVINSCNNFHRSSLKRCRMLTQRIDDIHLLLWTCFEIWLVRLLTLYILHFKSMNTFGIRSFYTLLIFKMTIAYMKQLGNENTIVVIANLLPSRIL